MCVLQYTLKNIRLQILFGNSYVCKGGVAYLVFCECCFVKSVLQNVLSNSCLVELLVCLCCLCSFRFTTSVTDISVVLISVFANVALYILCLLIVCCKFCVLQICFCKCHVCNLCIAHVVFTIFVLRVVLFRLQALCLQVSFCTFVG